jgi:hypothetical protein
MAGEAIFENLAEPKTRKKAPRTKIRASAARRKRLVGPKLWGILFRGKAHFTTDKTNRKETLRADQGRSPWSVGRPIKERKTRSGEQAPVKKRGAPVGAHKAAQTRRQKAASGQTAQ